MSAPSAPASWVAEEIERAEGLLGQGEVSEAVRLLAEAERGAVAQGYPELLPKIAALAEAVGNRSHRRTRRQAERVATRIAKRQRRTAIPEAVSDAPRHRTAPTSSAPPVARRHPRGRVIAFIWIGVFIVGVIAAAVLQDDNPATDDAAAFGALAAVAGTILTGVYAVASLIIQAIRERSPERSRLTPPR
jgi:hypothetical protein